MQDVVAHGAPLAEPRPVAEAEPGVARLKRGVVAQLRPRVEEGLRDRVHVRQGRGGAVEVAQRPEGQSGLRERGGHVREPRGREPHGRDEFDQRGPRARDDQRVLEGGRLDYLKARV